MVNNPSHNECRPRSETKSRGGRGFCCGEGDEDVSTLSLFGADEMVRPVNALLFDWVLS